MASDNRRYARRLDLTALPMTAADLGDLGRLNTPNG
jgi:hypothetical protein